MRITDEQMIAATARIEHESFTVTDVQADAGQSMRMQFRIAGDPGIFAVRLPLPSANRLKPWLSAIPEDADDAAAMLAGFVMEEVDTGCAHWGLTTVEGIDRVFTLEPYGFRPADSTRHRQLMKSAGPTGWWGWIQENDDPTALQVARRAPGWPPSLSTTPR